MAAIPASFDVEAGSSNLDDNLKLWLDASRVSGFTDSNGNNQYDPGEEDNPSDGGVVVTWKDLSGNGNNSVSSNSYHSRSPYYRVDNSNGNYIDWGSNSDARHVLQQTIELTEHTVIALVVQNDDIFPRPFLM